MAPPVRRVKSDVLSPFNDGSPFTVVRADDGRLGTIYGALAQEGRVCAWFDPFVSEEVSAERLREISLPAVNPLAREEVSATIGGLGRHLRWIVATPRPQLAGEVGLLVTAVRDKERFAQTIAGMQPFVVWDGSFTSEKESDDGAMAEITVLKGRNTGCVVARMQQLGYGIAFLDEAQASLAKLGVERFDRSEHMWWNQDSRRAGPLRDTHRWDFSWLPTQWKETPFTWHSLARNCLLSIEGCASLPMPFRDHVCKDRLEELRGRMDEALIGGDATLRAAIRTNVLRWRRLHSGRRMVTCRLSSEQNRQLLACGYFLHLSPFDADLHAACSALCQRYAIHGYTVREIGGYDQSAKHLGHGATIRRFKEKKQYDLPNLSASVVNRLMQSDGSLRGSGFKGSRGKYATQSRYTPKMREKPSLSTISRMREVKVDVFEQYSQALSMAQRTLKAGGQASDEARPLLLQ